MNLFQREYYEELGATVAALNGTDNEALRGALGRFFDAMERDSYRKNGKEHERIETILARRPGGRQCPHERNGGL
jgi:flagellar motor switch protein FliG